MTRVPEDLEVATEFGGLEPLPDRPGTVAGILPGKDPAAQSLGSRGGLKRAQNMTPERRSEIARLAAKSRWGKA